MTHVESCREWLRTNGYAHVAELIDEIIEEWRRTGNKTRRNWWETLAGNKKGLGRVVAGRLFPVLPEVIQRHQPQAEQPNATIPAVRVSNRWPPSDPGAF